MLRDKVFLIGLRYGHHAEHSGYEAFRRYVGSLRAAPVNFRWTLGRWGWPLNRFIATITRHDWYSLGALLTELVTLANMVLHRRRLYHILYGDSDLWLLRMAHRVTGHRLIASFHQPTNDLKSLNVVERISRYLDGVILVSETQRPYFEEFISSEKIFVVPHGVDSEFFCPDDNAKFDRPTCVSLGSHLRDFDVLADCIRIVWSLNPETQFVLIGSRHEDNSPLQALHDDRIRFLENISDDDLLTILRGSRVAVFSFRDATANNAILETMATGLPVVTTDIPALHEYVPRKGGIFVPREDAESMASAIVSVINDETIAQEMSRACRERACQLDFRNVAKQHQLIYEAVLTARSERGAN